MKIFRKERKKDRKKERAVIQESKERKQFKINE